MMTRSVTGEWKIPNFYLFEVLPEIALIISENAFNIYIDSFPGISILAATVRRIEI